MLEGLLCRTSGILAQRMSTNLTINKISVTSKAIKLIRVKDFSYADIKQLFFPLLNPNMTLVSEG